MCSFDITSLFTNILLEKTIEIILNKLFPNINSVYKNFTKIEFKSLLQLANKNSIYMFNQELYEQIDGVAMGSPCGPTLANLFLCHYENIWLNNVYQTLNHCTINAMWTILFCYLGTSNILANF